MITKRASLCSVLVDGKIYLIGGDSNNASAWTTAAFEIYDIATDTWQKNPDLPSPREYAGVFAANNKIYCFGGQNRNTTYVIYPDTDVYDITTGLWSKAAPIPFVKGLSGCVQVGSKVYLIGGRYKSGSSVIATNTLHIYDTDTNIWTTGIPLPASLYCMSCAVLGDNIYCVGGTSNTSTPTIQNQTYVYNITENKWYTKKVSPLVSVCQSCVMYNGELYVMGGHNDKQTFNLQYIYNPVNDEWRIGKVLPFSVSEAELVQTENKWYVIGGFNSGSYTNPLKVDNVHIYTLQSKITEKFHTQSGAELAQDNIVPIEEGSTYSKTAPTFNGYKYIEYRIDENVPNLGSTVTLDTLADEEHTITFIYSDNTLPNTSLDKCCCTKVKLEIETCINNKRLLRQLQDIILDEENTCSCGCNS